MTRFGLTAAVLAAGVLLWSSSAKADTITLNGGQTPFFPPTVTMLASGSSPLAFTGACCPTQNTFGTVHVDMTGSPPLPQGELLSNTISVRSSNGPSRTMFLWVTETGITAPLGTDQFTSGLTANLLSGSITTVTLSTYLNPSNIVSPIGTTNGQDLLDTATFTAIGHQTNTVTMPVGPGPYALVEVYAITSNGAMGGGSSNLTVDLETRSTTVIPEPATLALLGTGLVGIAGLGRRR